MLYTLDETTPNRELHLVMLSPSTSGSNVARADGTYDSRLFFYVNRSYDEVMRNQHAFVDAPLTAEGVQTRGFAVMTLEPERFRDAAYDDCVLPDAEGGVVLRFKLEPNIMNPTKAIAELGKSLAEGLGLDIREVKFSGAYGQEGPTSYGELSDDDFPADYLDVNAVMALPTRMLVAG